MKLLSRKSIVAVVLYALIFNLFSANVYAQEPTMDPVAAATIQAQQQQAAATMAAAAQEAVVQQQIAAATAASQANQATMAAAQAQTAPVPAAPAPAAPADAGSVTAGNAAANGYVLAGSCTTSFSGSSGNRINNLQVASGRFNGLVVAPGQAVSVSTTILPRTAENGYKTAGVYSGGKTVQGMGGGICQVSSTIYNAVMNAGLNVTSRSPHSMPVHYLPLGQDAAISAGSKDMIFVNPYDTPVLITTSCDAASKKLTVSVFVKSESLAGRSYRFYAKSTGSLSADAYRDIYLNGVLVGTEYIGHSSYSRHS